jgi:predicted O-methyltransferase YrrM
MPESEDRRRPLTADLIAPLFRVDGPFAIGEPAIQHVIDLARETGAKRILEFGSGRSTVRLALELPDVLITSVEHDQGFADQTERILAEAGVAANVVLIRSELGWWHHHGRIFYTYVTPLPDLLYDLVLIDGPPGYLHTGRQGAFHRAFDRLPIGAHVVLDDFNEPREQRAVRRWLRDYPDGLAAREVPAGDKRLAILQKTGNGSIRSASPGIVAANLCDNGRGVVRRTAHRGAQLVRALRRDRCSRWCGRSPDDRFSRPWAARRDYGLRLGAPGTSI